MKITPEAVEAFVAMENAVDDDAWWRWHQVLHRALGLTADFPDWPAVEDPRAVCPYPADSFAARGWHQDRERRPEAFARFAALTEAAKR
jgi:hypothetical protein